ncbi:MAG: hypothetical protein HOW73_10790 [Polyangiaceae bacterium]|nr:hypothetical protein [Polyangiaceae bacterium]
MPRFGLLVSMATATVSALTLASVAAHADPLSTNDYQIDLYQGPLLLPIRVVSLGGSYAGYGEDISGMVANAAAPAVREAHAFRHVEVDLAGSFSFPLDLFENNDFDNSGDIDADYSSFIYLNGGVMVQVGSFGAGVLGDLQTYRLTNPSGTTTAVVVGRYHGLVATSLVEGQLAVGAGVRAVSMGFATQEEDDFYYVGASPQVGFLARPNGIPFRFGATIRMPVTASPANTQPRHDGVARVGNLTLPNRVVQPWELEVGVAVQVGPRPLNIPFVDPEDMDDEAEQRVKRAREDRARDRQRILDSEPDPERRATLDRELRQADEDLRAQEEAWLDRESDYALGRLDDAFSELPRQRLLLLLSLVTSGPVARGVSLERFLAQNEPAASSEGVIGKAGAEVNFSPRFGVEGEPIDNRLVMRVGSYYEPSRFSAVGRQHFTFGALLKLFTTDVFGLLPELPYGVEAGVDLAPRYQSVSATITAFR